MQLALRKFSMDWIADESTVVFVGKRGTGKSTAVKDLMYHKRSIPVGTVISGTENANPFFGDFVPDVFIYGEYQPHIVSNVVKRQKLVKKQIKRDKEMYGSSRIDPRAFLVLDDCLYDDTWTREKSIREIFMNGRHINSLFVVTMQYPLGIPPNLRTNVDFTFIMRENVVGNRKRIYENYAGMFPTFDMFCQIMDACTENRECLVIRNNAQSNKITDQVFWYRAELHDNFRIGLPEYWAMSRDVQEEEEDVADMQYPLTNAYNPSAYTRRRGSGPMIRVQKKI